MIHKILIVIIAVTAGAQAQKFEFGRTVTEKSVYENAAKFGFEPGAAVKCGAKSCASDKPFYFSAHVPEGNYLVTVTFGDEKAASDNTVRAELRRLMVENLATKKGKFATATFVVNVRRPEFPGGAVKLKDREKTMEWWAWDDKLTLEFGGAHPAVSAIKIEKADKLPTIFLLGDSTVCDQPREPYASWGQMFTNFVGPNAAVANHAESGESYRSSFGAKRLEKVLSLMKPGDFVMLQYAHNDEKEKGDGVGAMTSFKASILQWVAAIRAKGGNPVLVTPMHRRTFGPDGKITNSHGEYPDAVRAAAKEANVPLVELTSMSARFYEALGKDGSGAAFKEGDGTYHNNYGAYELALMIADSLRAQKLPVAAYLKKQLPKPVSPSEFRLPASPMVTDVKPLGN